MMIYDDFMIDFGWMNVETLGLGWEFKWNSRKGVNRDGLSCKPYDCLYDEMYDFVYRHQNLIKSILDETRHL